MTSTELVIPTGELVPLGDPPRVAQALEDLRHLEQQIRMAKAELTHALVEHGQLIGSKTIQLGSGKQATIKDGRETVYDAHAISEGLREAGMPEDRISEIVVETVIYKVNAVEAKRAAAINDTYAQVIKENSHIEERSPTIWIKH